MSYIDLGHDAHELLALSLVKVRALSLVRISAFSWLVGAGEEEQFFAARKQHRLEHCFLDFSTSMELWSPKPLK